MAKNPLLDLNGVFAAALSSSNFYLLTIIA